MSRSILITGCSSGIGLDAARTLHARGWRVLATCRRAEDRDRLAAEGLESFTLDLADAASVEAGAAEALERTGGAPDAIFNNGAFAIPGGVEDLGRDALREIFETNLFGQIDLTNRVLPAMRARGSGRIVMTSSVLGFVSTPWRGAYSATKFALEAMTDALRMELHATPIRVSLIEPGPITTEFRRNAARAFARHVDWRASPHRAAYEETLMARLNAAGGPPDRFELPPSAVTARLIHALENARPKARYPVTIPAHAAGLMRRLMPTALLDAVLRRR